MPQCGDVFYHPDFPFRDGGSSNKYMILLNANPSNDKELIFIKVTSKEKSPKASGCHKKYKTFFLPSGDATFFKKDTWIQFHDYGCFLHSDICSKCSQIGTIKAKMMNQILECCLPIFDEIMPGKHLKLIRPKQNSLADLQNKFKLNR